MRKVILFVFVCLSTIAVAQHKATLSWQPSPDAQTNPTIFYTVYRALGPCPATGSPTTLVRVGSTLAGILSYEDTNVQAAQTYCYIVRAALGNIESIDSNTTAATIPLAPSSGLTVLPQ